MMKQEEAQQIIENLIIATQRARSMVSEMVNPDDDEVVDAVIGDLFPYSQGDGVLLNSLLKMASKPIIPHDFYNIITLVKMKCVDVEGAYVVGGFGALPEPDLKWLSGFDKSTGKED